MLSIKTCSLVAFFSFPHVLVSALDQTHLSQSMSDESNRYFTFHKPVKRVAVIGGGASGLLHASTLLRYGFEVRLFERAPNPGGQWLYTDQVPVHASFP